MKKGISLIAVLMFMLAATTGSVVLFKWIGQENFGSGARLKKSEAYQASQAGLEAVQGWLTNKGADAGALIKTFELAKKPVLMKTAETGGYDLLGEFKGNKQQEFKVYLTGVDVSARPYKMKFLSEGIGRDGSRHSQAGIFNVEGLYKMGLEPKPLTTFSPGGRRVPPYFGGIGGGSGGEATQGNFSSGYIIGDMIASQGISSTEDLMVTGNVDVSSGMKIGCPNNVDTQNYPSNYEARKDAGEFGNFYVRENLASRDITVCGDAYVGGNLSVVSGTIHVWGNLYVKGNVTSKTAFRVYGNATVEGNMELEGILEIKGNLVMPSATNPTHNITLKDANKVDIGQFWGATTVNCSYINANTNTNQCGKFTGSSNTYPNVTQVAPPGGDALDYLGSQISKERNQDGKYIIPDPIVLGAAADWKTSDIPTSCAALKNPSWYSNGVITLKNASGNIDGDNGARSLRDAIHSCYNNSNGNWNSSNNSSKWLVIRIDWQGPSDAIGRMILGQGEMNLIFVMVNKPTADVYLPLTTNNTNILLYLTQGATNIFLDRPAGIHNYFIYSEGDISKIDGNQYLKGNLFMANGSKVNVMKDPRIEENERLFEALSGAGVIKTNPNACESTVGGCEAGPGSEVSVTPQSLIGCESLAKNCDPSLPYVPVIPHLKVELQGQYANEEAIGSGDYVYAKPAILVMPRAIYLPANTQITKQELAKRISVLPLNVPFSEQERFAEAAKLEIMQSNCDNITNSSESNLYSCTVKLSDCTADELCRNSFYLARGMQPASFEPVEPPIEPIYSSSSRSSASTSSSSVKSSSSVQQTASGLECNVSPAVAEGSKISSAITAICNYSDGTYEWAIVDEYYDGASWIQASNTTAALAKGTNKSIKIKARCSSTDPITEYDCGTLNVVGITCAFQKFGDGAGTRTFAKGEQINGPVVTCNSGTATKDNATFSSDAGAVITAIRDVNSIKSHPILNSTVDRNAINERGWISFSGFAYFASGTIGATGTDERHVITVSDVSCGNVSGLSAKCTNQIGESFTITNPVCTSASGSHAAGSPISIPVYCDQSGTVPMTNAVFSSPGNSDWINNGTGGVFVNTTGSKQITLNEGECWGRKISGLDINCGTVNVTAPSGGDGDCYDYDPAWCGYIPHASVERSSYRYPQTGTQYDYEGSSNGFNVGSGGRCIFATSIQAMGNNSSCSYYKVNGVSLKGQGNPPRTLDGNNYSSCTNSPISHEGSGRCGRIKMNTSQPPQPLSPLQADWDQQLCPAALANVPKADGGYYIYIAPGSQGWAGDFVTTGGTPVCGSGGGSSSGSGGGTACDYNPADCGGIAYSQVRDNTTENPTTAGECIFYSQISQIQAGYEGTLCVNGVCKNNSGWYNLRDFPPKKDDGYYVHCKTENCFSYSNGVLAGTKRTGCTPTPPSGGGGSSSSSSSSGGSSSAQSSSATSTPTATCTFSNQNVKLGQNIPPPTISCSNGGNATNPSSLNFGGNDLPQNSSNWKNTSGNKNAYYKSEGTKIINVSNITCGGTDHLTASCTINVSKPTCTVGNQTVNSGSTITPTVDCGGGTPVLSNSSFDIGGNATTNCSWTGDGNGGTIARNPAGSCNLMLKSLACDSGNETISGINNPCDGTITVNVGGGSSSGSGGGGGGTQIVLPPTTNPLPAGTYVITAEKTCQVQCESGTIIATGSASFSCNSNANGGNAGQHKFPTGSTLTLTGTGTLKFNQCW